MSMWKPVMPVVMKAIFVRGDVDIEVALDKCKQKMPAIIKDVCDRAAVGAEGKPTAAANPDNPRAAKK